MIIAPFPALRPGLKGLKQEFKIFLEATRAITGSMIRLPGRKVVTRLTAIGVHERDLMGIPRTGNTLEMTAIVIHRIANGKLAEKWSNKDVLGFLQQLGVMPKPGQSSAA